MQIHVACVAVVALKYAEASGYNILIKCYFEMDNLNNICWLVLGITGTRLHHDVLMCASFHVNKLHSILLNKCFSGNLRKIWAKIFQNCKYILLGFVSNRELASN